MSKTIERKRGYQGQGYLGRSKALMKKLSQPLWSLTFGVTLALLLIIINANVQPLFGITPSYEKVEFITVLILVSFSLGYFLSSIFETKSPKMIFVSGFIGTILVVFIFSSPFQLERIVLALSTLSGIALIQSGLIKKERIQSALNLFFKEFVWYLFGAHIIYAYELPTIIALSIKVEISTSLSFGIMTISLVAYYLLIYRYVGERKFPSIRFFIRRE